MESKTVRRHISIKATAEGGEFKGILSTYGNVDEVYDTVVAGAFDEGIKRKGTKYPLLFQHDSGSPIGSFDVTSTDPALEVNGKFNLQVQKGKEAYELLKAGDINGLSIGYYPTKYHFDEEGVRHLTEVELMEGSFVTFPANTEAYAEAKSMAENIMSKRKDLMKLKFIKNLEDDEQADAIDELLELIDDEETEEDAKENADEPSEEDEKSDETDDEEESELAETVRLMEELVKRLKLLDMTNVEDEEKENIEEDEEKESDEDENGDEEV